eukprot:TRINITY_DN3075_c0_g1_i2.p1 TRINITY_DN3075_c0_g1~~TRINITY_DN3075_c0_g1_i2.p1  ORF type:complete len:379 (-),score=83.53 TRINITY_DN3075_c0_g1_i2:396-1532(-)
MAVRAAFLAAVLAAPAAAQAPTSAPTSAPIGPFDTTLTAVLASGDSVATVTDVVGCLPDGTVTFSPAGGTAMSRTIVTCTGSTGSTGTVEFTPSSGSTLISGTPVQFAVPSDATTSSAAATAGTDTVTVSDTSSCQVDGTITFGSSEPEEATVVSCGTRRLAEESDEMFSSRRLVTNQVTFNPALTNTQPAGTPITFTSSSAVPSCFAMEATVQGLAGQQPLSSLRAGDRVLANGEFTEVVGFLHDLPKEGAVVVIEHASGELRATSNHVLLVDGQDKQAGAVQIGNMIPLSDGSLSRVVAVRRDAAQGLRAPLTKSGLIDVDEVVASNYAVSHGIEVPHSAMHAAFSMVRFASGFFGAEVAKAEFKTAFSLAAVQTV